MIAKGIMSRLNLIKVEITVESPAKNSRKDLIRATTSCIMVQQLSK